MRRPRTPADLIFLATSVFAGPVVLAGVTLTALAASEACATEDTTEAPDEGIPKCKTGPYLFCQEAAPGAPSCNTDDGTSPFLQQVPRAKNYAVGCVINFVGERDQQGDCVTEAVCKCLIGELPSDAGASIAAAPDATPVPGPTGPLWNCAAGTP
jgi:hypothetical protein